ncbi:MAG: late competence development ComFB family protein, partial [Spirochaetales bacterium]|nr:late competence development ComFB family protein [Spirochaetales bacterium]
MAIHNLMEELAASVLDEVCKEDQAGSRRYCVSEQCRTDALCYILNRISPRYISSGRGFAHLTEELQEDQQLMIDVMRLVHEGLQRVSAVRRTFYDVESKDALQGACFNFPTIKGRLLDGAGFLPVSEVDVQLFLDGALVEMFDSRWSNPYHVSAQTPGTFIFWPATISVAETGSARTFE